MQSSVRTETPCFAPLPEGSVFINSEVSVISSPSPAPTNIATIPSTANGHGRAESRTSFRSTTASTATQAGRKNSHYSKGSKSSSRYPVRGHQYRSSTLDVALLENNRESMKALADFLMTRDPPRTNLMSIASEENLLLPTKERSSFRLFGRSSSKSKLEKQKKLLQLPDSAVAATTRGGTRHIAISIPIQLEPEVVNPKSQPAIQPIRSIPKRSTERTDRGAVTVLKPVSELRESTSANLDAAMSRRSSMSRRSGSLTQSKSAEILGLEGIRAVEAYYSEPPEILRQRFRHGSATQFIPDPLRSHKSSYVAVSPVDMARQESQASDPRHSGGTIYSTMTMGTVTPHSRGPSNGSVETMNINGATLISSLKLDLPPRISSIAKVPTSKLNASNVPVYNHKKSNSLQSSNTDKHHRQDSLNSATTTTSTSPPTVYITGTAETARVHGVVRSTTPNSHQLLNLPPNSKLPALPINTLSISKLSRSATAPPAQNRNNIHISDLQVVTVERKKSKRKELKDAGTSMGTNPKVDEGLERQARVKARKMRDLEVVRATSRRSGKHIGDQVLMNGDVGKKVQSEVSRVMVVVDLPPYPEINLEHPTTPTNSPFQNERGTMNGTDLGTQPIDQPPRGRRREKEPTTPLPTNDSSTSTDIDGLAPTPDHRKKSPALSIRSSILNTRRQERRVKRDLKAREQELDDRIARLERDNHLLMGMVGLIGRRVSGNLRMEGVDGEGERGGEGYGYEARKGTWGERNGREDRESGVFGELVGMEPVMRDLQGNAGRVSGEGFGGWGRGRGRYGGREESGSGDGGREVLF